MKTKLTLLIIIILTSYSMQSQICGTTSTENVSYSRKTATNTSFLNSSNSIYINVSFHIVRNTNGTNVFTPPDLDAIISNLNTYYSSHNITFRNAGSEFINNTSFVNIGGKPEAISLGQVNNRSNAINYYIVETLWNTPRGTILGVANGILSNGLVIINDKVLASSSPHEIGHCLNLLHTFQGTAVNTDGCAEYIISSSPNCDDCGDKVCDTPADANTRNEGDYNPDLTNIMSYYRPRNHFTNGQADRIRIAFASSSLLQRVVVAGSSITELVGNSNICNTPNYTYTLKNYSSPNSTSWSVSSNLQKVSSNNTSITVRAINSSVNGISTITTISTIGTIAKKDIWIGKPKIDISLSSVVNYVYIDIVGANNTDISKQGITATNLEKVSNSGGCYANFSGRMANGNCLNWIIRVKITATNSCGTTIIYRDVTPPPPAPCDTLTFDGESFYIINPCDGGASSDADSTDSFTTNNNKIIKRVMVYDITGRIIKGFPSENINISNLSSGIYIIKVELTSGKILTKKIVK